MRIRVKINNKILIFLSLFFIFFAKSPAQKILDPAGASTLHNLNCVITVDNSYYTTIQSAVNAAGTKCGVVIPGNYLGVDTFTNPNNVTIIDYRNNSLKITSSVNISELTLGADQ